MFDDDIVGVVVGFQHLTSIEALLLHYIATSISVGLIFVHIIVFVGLLSNVVTASTVATCMHC